MLFLGPMFERGQEKALLALSRQGVSNAANTFQWNMINGLRDNHLAPLSVCNVLPVGTWPGQFRRLLLQDRVWRDGEVRGTELGCVNLPLVKQLQRYRKARRLLSGSTDPEILIFTAYLPFLAAARTLPPERSVTLVVTDLPEYYDMRQVSAVRKALRRVHNLMVYRCLVRVDRFVLLTEQMAEPLRVGDRPYLVLEGICDAEESAPHAEPDGCFSMLYTGRLNRRYGLEMLLDAMERLPDPELELWICGSGEMEQEIRSRAERDSRIRFFGFLRREETLALQRKATVLVNPRTGAGAYTKYSFPSKTMEYLASGRPVMMYRLAGIPAEYDPYLVYIPEETVEAVCDALKKLRAMSPEARTQLGARGQAFVLGEKNRTVQMRRLIDFIKGAEKNGS